MNRQILVFALIVSCLTVSAAEQVPKELTPDQEAAAIQSAETRGLAIYRHDHAAAVATDEARKLRAFKRDKRVRGWITEEQQGKIVVTFIDQTPVALYRSVVSEEGVAGPVTAFDSPTVLSEYEMGAAAARTAAIGSKFQPCTENYNSVVLPAAEKPGKDWVVYLLPSTTKDNVVPIGGTYRIETSGSNVTNQRGFTRTCIALKNEPGLVAFMVTHLMDPIPTEAHVFWSLWANKSMYVATTPNGTIWVVEGSKIRLVQRRTAGN